MVLDDFILSQRESRYKACRRPLRRFREKSQFHAVIFVPHDRNERNKNGKERRPFPVLLPLFFLREADGDLRALADLAFERDRAMVVRHGVLDDGQPQPRAAARLGVALVHAVEALEDAALMLRRDADARVAHGETGAAALGADAHIHAAAVRVVFDRVVAEVVSDLIEEPPHAGDRGVLARDDDPPVKKYCSQEHCREP